MNLDYLLFVIWCFVTLVFFYDIRSYLRKDSDRIAATLTEILNLLKEQMGERTMKILALILNLLIYGVAVSYCVYMVICQDTTWLRVGMLLVLVSLVNVIVLREETWIDRCVKHK